MSFKINPVKAAARAYREGNCGIHALNDACFETCAAFSGTDSPWSIPSDCAGQCTKFVNNLRKQFYGLSYCDHQQPYRPVLWDQTPNFFPQALEQHKNVPQALAASLKMCEKTKYPQQCKDKALLQSYAVEQIGQVEPSREDYQELYRENYNDDNSSDDDARQDIDFDKYEKSHPWIFWIGFSIAAIFFIIFFILLVKVIMKR